MILGLPDPQQHRVIWHEVKLATVFDPRQIKSSFCAAAAEDSETFGQRLWNEFDSSITMLSRIEENSLKFRVATRTPAY